jgi:hypothetical protein
LYRHTLARVGGQAAIAADLCQLTLVQGVVRFEDYRGHTSLFEWLCQIELETGTGAGLGASETSSSPPRPEEGQPFTATASPITAPPPGPRARAGGAASRYCESLSEPDPGPLTEAARTRSGS